MENTINVELEEAVRKNYVDKVRELLERDADPNWKPRNDYRSLLHMAVDNQNIDAIEQLVKHGAGVDAEEIEFIFEQLRTEFTKEVVSRILKHNSEYTIVRKMFDELVKSNHHVGPLSAEILGLLFNHGLPCEYDYHENFFPINVIIQNGKVDLIPAILDNGVDVNAPFSNGKTLLTLTLIANHNNEAMMDLLIKRGAQVNYQNPLGVSAFHTACLSLRTSFVRLLLDRGADVNEKTKYGVNPLCLAIMSGRVETVKLLLERGARLTDRTSTDISVLQFAIQCGNTEMVSFLLNSGCDPNEKIKCPDLED